MAGKLVCLLTVTGPQKLIDQFAQRAEGARLCYPGDPPFPLRRQPMSFHALVPVPQKKITRHYIRRSKACVQDSGRDWEIEHWGCPRGAIQSSLSRDKGRLTYLMTVRVAPPTTFFRAASALFPTLHFTCFTLESRTQMTVQDEFQAGRHLSSVDPFATPAVSSKVRHHNRSRTKNKWPKRAADPRAFKKH